MSAGTFGYLERLADALGEDISNFDGPRCGAKDRNAKCVRAPGHEGWHRSKTGVVWPDKAAKP